MIDQWMEEWHAFVAGHRPDGLDDLLDDDVVFLSPIVHSPQTGKALTTMYLNAAYATFSDGHADNTADNTDEAPNGSGPGSFRYIKEVRSANTAILEFETQLGATYVNGVDIITFNDEGRIVEFKVMIRPLRAINLMHERMAAMIEQLHN